MLLPVAIKKFLRHFLANAPGSFRGYSGGVHRMEIPASRQSLRRTQRITQQAGRNVHTVQGREEPAHFGITALTQLLNPFWEILLNACQNNGEIGTKAADVDLASFQVKDVVTARFWRFSWVRPPAFGGGGACGQAYSAAGWPLVHRGSGREACPGADGTNADLGESGDRRLGCSR